MAVAGDYTPVLVGVGDVVCGSASREVGDAAMEPLALMGRALARALLDTGLGAGVEFARLREAVDDVRVVRNWTWVYGDVCGEVWEGMWDGEGGRERRRGRELFKEESAHGGNEPIRLVDSVCRRVGRGETKVGVVVGGEALGSLIASVQKTGTYPQHWTPPAGDPRKILALPKDVENPGTIHSIGLPIHIYPLYENAFRAHRQQTPSENHKESAKLYAQFAKVAAGNEFAWNREQARGFDEEKIGKVGKGNRMICWPYPLLMNAFNNVNMAAGCIITSVEFATELGISEDKWIYPLGGAGMRERENFWERPNFYSSEAMEKSLDAALNVSGLRTEDIDLLDLYSCFPIVPKMAARHLKIPFLDPPKPITLLGGLTSFGGAGNNYSLHALTEMTRQLRATRSSTHTPPAPNPNNKIKSQQAKNGLILANGGVLSYQHVICLSTNPPIDHHHYHKQYQDGNGSVGADTLEKGLDGDREVWDGIGVEGVGTGVWEGVIETYTVQFSRANLPEMGFIVGRLKENGRRFLANVEDEKTLSGLVGEEEAIGKGGWVWMQENGQRKRNLFAFERGANL